MIDEKVGTLRAQHEELGRAVTEIIANYVATLDARKVTSPAGPQELERMFAEPFPEQATAASDILNRFRDEVLEHAMQVPSPRYFGQFNPTPLPIGVWADALASVLNQNAGAWRNGPTSAVIEARVMRWLCELIGYESKSFGTLASGGTEANLIALKCARDNAHATGVQDGLRTAAANLVVYASEQVHFSVERSVDILGLGRASLRKIKTAPNFHVDTNQLRAQIETDIKAGFRPCCVVGLAGATSTGVIDPLEDLAQIAADYSCWYHIDAAYGGTLAFSEKHRHKLRGIERANSVTLDPHKWMFVPFACGALLVRDGGGVLRDAFDITPEYLNEDRGGADVQFDFFRYGQMGTRRFNSLKLWMALKFMGRQGYAGVIEKQIELTDYFAQQIEALADFETLHKIETAVCCFRWLPDNAADESTAQQDRRQQQLQQAIERSGEAWLHTTVLNGRRCLRVNINSFLTEQRHVDDLLELLQRKTKEIRAS